MFQKIYQSKYFFPALLFLISVVLFITNYKPGTFLVGWDNLFPELNFDKAIKVNLFGIWQWYRGLGSQDGLAHAASLPHTIFLYFLSKILPLNTLRYVFQILMHLLGGLGIYYLLLKYKKNNFLAFVGALFYEFNLATIQMFYAPLEVFSVHFAVLPWLIYSILTLLEKRSKTNLLIFFLLSLVTTTQGFVPTVFIAYLFSVLSVLALAFFKNGKNSLKTSTLILTIIFVTNAFWLLPFAHSAITQGKVIKNTKINQLSSDSIYERNKKRGGIIDLLYLKGFMLDTAEDNLKNKQELIMKDWNIHINNPYIFLILTGGVLIFLTGIARTIYQLKKYRTPGWESYFLPLLLICWLMLGTRVPILSVVSDKLRVFLPLFGEAFRFPITKFFIVYSFTYSIFFVSGLEYIISKKFPFRKIILLFSAVSIFLSAIPSFQGKFFFAALRLKIPEEYFQTINYFKNENKSGRIMTLPQATFWNWMFYSWGSRGSGFLWYGIEQPMLERPFDPWNNFNEQYYNEVFYALQTENEILFKNVINKYDISFILIDGYRNVESKIQQKDKIESYIRKVLPGTTVTRLGNITIYKLTNKNSTSVQVNNLKQSSPFYYEFKDSLYEKYGNYISSENWEKAYLFPSLFSNKTQEDLNFSFEEVNNNIQLKSKNKISLDNNLDSIYFSADSYPPDESLIPVRIVIEEENIIIKPVGVSIKSDSFEKEILPFDPIKIQISSKNIPAFSEIKLNGNTVNASDEAAFGLAYSHLENTLYTASAGIGISNNFKLTGNQNNLSFAIPVKAITSSLRAEYPILRPAEWQTTNLLENKNYLVEAPCPDDIQPGLSVYEENNTGVNLTSKTSSACLHQYLNGVAQNIGVYFNFSATNISGPPMFFVIDNPQQDANIIDTKLNPNSSKNIILVPPTSKYFYSDYGTHFRNASSGSETAHNKINWMNIGYFPYNWIKTFRLEKNADNESAHSSISQTVPIIEQKFVYTSSRGDDIDHDNDETYFYLAQSFNPGWLAYQIKDDPSQIKVWIRSLLPFLYGKRLTEHVLVNNWANGWALRQGSAPQGKLDKVTVNSNSNQNTNIVVIFWPQYLQFFGFALLIGSFIWILKFKSSSNSN